MAKLLSGYFQAKTILRETGAQAVVGFGGYPTLPPLMAGRSLGLPTCVHEANAVMGRVNRFLARRVTAVAATFEHPLHFPEEASARLFVTGNPVRANVRALSGKRYHPGGPKVPLKLLVFGGSQGARIMSDIVPEAVALLLASSGISIVQQAREEDLERVKARYRELGVEAEVAPFFDDLPRRIADSHLVVSRSGASTVSELAVIGRPGILVPLPHALDNDQRENALRFSKAGGGWLVDQSEFTPQRLAEIIEDLRQHRNKLADAAAAASAFAILDAESRLADLVEGMIEAARSSAGAAA